MISLSAAAVGAQAAMTHGCVFPALRGSCTMDPQLDCEDTLVSSAHKQPLSGRHTTYILTYWEAGMCMDVCLFLLLGIAAIFWSHSAVYNIYILTALLIYVCACVTLNFLFLLLSNRKMKCIWIWFWITFLRPSTEWPDTTAEPNRLCPWFTSRYGSVYVCVCVCNHCGKKLHFINTRDPRKTVFWSNSHIMCIQIQKTWALAVFAHHFCMQLQRICCMLSSVNPCWCVKAQWPKNRFLKMVFEIKCCEYSTGYYLFSSWTRWDLLSAFIS